MGKSRVESRARKDRNLKYQAKKRKLGLKPKKNKQQQQPPTESPPAAAPRPGPSAAFSNDDEDDAFDFASSPPSPGRIHRLLEPYSKDQLAALLLDAATADPALLARVRAVADSSVAHRKLFVHGLSWEATTDTLLRAFRPFGPIESCNVVTDKATGRSKGFGFVVFQFRSAASLALKDPQKKIDNRIAYCQLASAGPVPNGGTAQFFNNTPGRKIYVSNVHEDAQLDKLKALFAQFGEIEAGPLGLDMYTGKSRGFALFVYKNQEGAQSALKEPYKMFDGRMLHCRLAIASSQKGNATAASTGTTLQVGADATLPVLAAVAAAQNLALLGQNPAYAALLGQNPLLAAAALNPAAAAAALNPAVAAAALNPAAAAAAFNPAAAALNPMLSTAGVGALNANVGLAASQGQAFGGAGVGGGGTSLLGPYGGQGASGLQGMQLYQSSQLGQSSSSWRGGKFEGFP